MCGKEDIRDNFAKHLTRPYALQGPLHTPQSFQTVRKKGSKDRDLTVFYWPFKNGLPFNQTASNMFKMQIYGDVLLVQQTREPCFLPRDRYVAYSPSTSSSLYCSHVDARVYSCATVIRGEHNCTPHTSLLATSALQKTTRLATGASVLVDAYAS